MFIKSLRKQFKTHVGTVCFPRGPRDLHSSARTIRSFGTQICISTYIYIYAYTHVNICAIEPSTERIVVIV